jgi:Xaa-Pro dipeptidase
MNIDDIAAALVEHDLDAWLFYDFFNRDPIAHRVLGLDYSRKCSRRWYYLIPARGESRRLVHAVERTRLDALPGAKRAYRTWRELEEGVRWLVEGCRRVAMNYSPRNEIPYVSIVDAGTVEQIRATGVQVVSSADLVQHFEARVDDAGFESHLEAGRRLHRVKDEAFLRIAEAIRNGRPVTEHAVQRFILDRLAGVGMTMEADVPVVAVNERAADPHFFPTAEDSREIRAGDRVLIDLWARLDRPDAIYHDITWVGYAGTEPPPRYREIFEIVRDARDAAVSFLRERVARGEPCCGWEADEACRCVIRDRGFGDAFVHRTGHCIGRTNHGNGVNLDNLEIRDTRRLVPGALFSVEPGIYLDGEMGVRSEIDVAIRPGPEVVVTGPVQDALVLLDV